MKRTRERECKTDDKLKKTTSKRRQKFTHALSICTRNNGPNKEEADFGQATPFWRVPAIKNNKHP